ncbi:hypothetical protein BaRGS_00012382 [Batillaria attramentaria]|uniref:Uncharacterized protein n=1 Tax=Batillaria attramentaria TaxID=370345 RepID=A0ABD0LAQ8_9CAEN
MALSLKQFSTGHFMTLVCVRSSSRRSSLKRNHLTARYCTDDIHLEPFQFAIVLFIALFCVRSSPSYLSLTLKHLTDHVRTTSTRTVLVLNCLIYGPTESVLGHHQATGNSC